MKTLLADAYDALELAAEAFGGVGYGEFYERNAWNGDALYDTPCCAHGLAFFACDQEVARKAENPITFELHRLDIKPGVSDGAVARINKRKGSWCSNRVSFAEWCAELQIGRRERRTTADPSQEGK